MVVTPVLTFVAAAAATTALVGGVRRYAILHQVIDHPGARSSHAIPTPRGGGAGLLTGWLLVVFPLLILDRQGGLPLLVSLVGVLVVAGAGWLDDHGGLSVRTRLGAHTLGALAILPLVILPAPEPAWPTAFVVVWWVFCAIAAANVVNFMDGIDGLIGVTALIFGLFGALVGSPDGTAAPVGLALAGAAAGFLVWNWSPARIFLGDVGSGALGYVFVVLGVLVMRESGRGIVTTFLPLWPICLDASATLARRWLRAEPLTQAHRSHLYQRLANSGLGHARVSLIFGAAALAGAVCSALPAGHQRSVAAGVYLVLTLAVGVALERRSLA